MKAIDNIKNKNNSGHDSTFNKFFKSVRYEVCKLLKLIINQMLTSCIFSEAFKRSKSIPLYKK